MGTVSNPAAGDVINYLMAVEKNEMQDKIKIKKTGAFQSRSVTVGTHTSQVSEIIKELGARIKAVDGVRHIDQANKLRDILNVFTKAETDDRSTLAKIQHTFSRNSTLSRLEEEIEKKIAASHVIQKLMDINTTEEMKSEIKIIQQGSQPRSISVDGKLADIKDVIQEIKVRVKDSESTSTELQSLISMLEAISFKDKADRKFKDKFYHAFSRRDSSIKESIRKADKNIVQKLLVNPVEIDLHDGKIPLRVRRLIKTLYQAGELEAKNLAMCTLYYVKKSDEVTFSLSKTNQSDEVEVHLYIHAQGSKGKISSDDQQFIKLLIDNEANIDETMLDPL